MGSGVGVVWLGEVWWSWERVWWGRERVWWGWVWWSWVMVCNLGEGEGGGFMRA